MSFVQDFVRPERMRELLLLCMNVVGITYGGMRLLQKLDDTVLADRRISRTAEICLCLLNGEIVYGFGEVGSGKILLAVFSGCLLSACIMDIESQMIYNYVWWLAWAAAGVYLCWKGGNMDWELFAFILLQEVFFSGFYGRADCHAFVACAVVERALGMGMKEYLIHMLLAYVFLAIVQSMRRNIERNGNLKKPIPFLPYITISFWVLISWEKSAIFIRV